MVAKPLTRFDDQGVIGWASHTYKLNIFGKQEFYMQADWKDVKLHGEGNAECFGYFSDLQNYYFSKIIINVEKPRQEKFVILDSSSIDI